MNRTTPGALPAPSLVVGARLMPYAERHFESVEMATRLGYVHNQRLYYTGEQLQAHASPAASAGSQLAYENLLARERPQFEERMRANGFDCQYCVPGDPSHGYRDRRVADHWFGWLECARGGAA